VVLISASSSESAASALVARPRQKRSERTLERIGKAVMSLMATRSFDEITVDEVVRRARTSVGSFYARFPGKDALLQWLEATYYGESRRVIAEALEPARWEGVGLAPMVRELARIYVRFLRQHAEIMRPMAIELRAHPGSRLHQHSRPLNHAAYDRFADLLLARRAEIRHPDPEKAVRFALAQMFATSHELLLFAESGLHPITLSDRQLASELAAGVLGYLGVTGEAAA
jgi:AcrR family transcriptional regulator